MMICIQIRMLTGLDGYYNMEYKVKKENLEKLIEYKNANTRAKREREAERFYEQMCLKYKQGV